VKKRYLFVILAFMMVISVVACPRKSLSAASRCSQIAGTWVYFPGNRTIFTANGQVSAPEKKQGGTWRCIDPVAGRIQVDWTINLRMTDTLSLSGDGNSMTGRNSLGFPLSVTRSGGGPAVAGKGAPSGAQSQSPDSPKGGERWGALAWTWGELGIALGRSINQPSEAEARRVANANCMESVLELYGARYPCQVVHVFNRGCAYIASGMNDQDQQGYYIGSSAREAIAGCAARGFKCEALGGCISR